MGFGNLITKAVATVVPDVLTTHKRPTVVDLGNQTLKNSKARSEVYLQLGIPPPEILTGTKDWYLSLGFARYLAIDVNTERDAVAMDLNVDIPKTYDFREQFDLVTNNGTGEHVFNQYMVFKNAHDLCRVGGFMIHVLPFYRWVDHGFFNYNPNLFPCLANQNGYELRELWIASSDTQYLHRLDVNNLGRNKGYRGKLALDTWESDPMVAAVFRKSRDAPFETPIQHMYGGENISDDGIAGKYR
jgi:hypothetical protein